MRFATLGAAALLLLAAGASRASVLDYILGRPPSREPPRAGAASPQPPPSPAWEGYLELGSVDAGKALYETGQLAEANRRVPACISCHGPGGVPQVGAPMPRLAGVTADYLAKQLDDFKAKRRQNEVMYQVVEAMSPADMGSAALYLASLSPAKWERTPAPGNEAGRRLQELGDNARAIPACGNCHGPEGRGSDQLLPPLAGLSAPYLREQLRQWRSGTRANDVDGVMRGIAAPLTDDEISGLADYYASMR